MRAGDDEQIIMNDLMEGLWDLAFLYLIQMYTKIIKDISPPLLI